MLRHMHFYLKCLKIEGLDFVTFSILKTGHVIFIRNSPLSICSILNLYARNYASFITFSEQDGKLAFHKIDIYISNKKHVTSLQTEKRQKMKDFDFGVFKIKIT